MPIRFIDRDEQYRYLEPAPFINISKSYQKQGDGEIVGSSYSITLTGKLLATQGSPFHEGTDHARDQTTSGWWSGSVSPVRDGTTEKYPLHGTYDAAEDETTIIGEEKWYKALQFKQKLLSNLFSKENEGLRIEVIPPSEDGEGGFIAFVKFESIDLPGHAPGNPNIIDYTINLTADYLLGPDGQILDRDDWESGSQDDNQGYKGWLVSSASESYDITEGDASSMVYDRNLMYGRGSGTGAGELMAQRKTYILTRTISATGKSKWNRETLKADGLEGFGDATGNRFDQKYAHNGRAWQQARGFIYDKITYGSNYLFGTDNSTATRKGGTEYETDEDSSGKNKPPTGDSTATNQPKNPDDIHLFGLNLPVPTNTNDKEIDQYKAYNYTRTQQADVRGGNFSVTETWTLAPKNIRALESVDFSISEDANSGLASVTINGTIVGLLDNADMWSDTDVTGVGKSTNPDRDPLRPADVDENFGGVDGDARGSKGTGGPDHATKNEPVSKYHNALRHYHLISPFMATTAQKLMDDVPEYSGLTINPVPRAKTVAQQIGTGTITYSLTYELKNRNIVPYVRNEMFTVSETYPGHVAAQHVVLGRRLGPVLQTIGTQTQWQRDFSITLNVDVHRENICVDSHNQIQPNIGDEDTCTGTAGTKPATNETIPDSKDMYDGNYRWVENPNYVSAQGGSTPFTSTRDISLSKPSAGMTYVNGAAGVGSAGTKTYALKEQSTAIKALIDSFNPSTYYEKGGSTPNITRKSYSNAPSESWNPKTGEYTYNVSWVYEINDPWQFPSTDYLAGANDDYLVQDQPGTEI
tara:strand:+ start:2311 stop:4746 length:2436 start_codon:yes stop_codon:yes gene_type:complete